MPFMSAEKVRRLHERTTELEAQRDRLIAAHGLECQRREELEARIALLNERIFEFEAQHCSYEPQFAQGTGLSSGIATAFVTTGEPKSAPQPAEAVANDNLAGFVVRDSRGRDYFVPADRTARNADTLYGWTPLFYRAQLTAASDHPAITHCDNCGCDWLDNGLNPVGCPYCKLAAAGGRELAIADAITWLHSHNLHSLLTDVQNGIDSPATAGIANDLLVRLDRIHAALAAYPTKEKGETK